MVLYMVTAHTPRSHARASQNSSIYGTCPHVKAVGEAEAAEEEHPDLGNDLILRDCAWRREVEEEGAESGVAVVAVQWNAGRKSMRVGSR